MASPLESQSTLKSQTSFHPVSENDACIALDVRRPLDMHIFQPTLAFCGTMPLFTHITRVTECRRQSCLGVLLCCAEFSIRPALFDFILESKKWTLNMTLKKSALTFGKHVWKHRKWRHPQESLEQRQKHELCKPWQLFLVTMVREGRLVYKLLMGCLCSLRFSVNCSVYIVSLLRNATVLDQCINLPWAPVGWCSKMNTHTCSSYWHFVCIVNVLCIIILLLVCVCKHLQPFPIFPCKIICIL